MTQVNESEYDRLFYPYLFNGGEVNAGRVLAQVQHSTLEKAREIIALRRATFDLHRLDLVAAGRVMATAFAAGGTLFAFGNGGSATDAQDIVADCVAPPHEDWQSLPAIALTTDSAIVTAVANDVGIDNIFARQIIALGKPGDMALGFSTSGSSRNVLAAFAQAKKQGLLTIGLAGYDGGSMAQAATVDYGFVAPSDHIPRIQETHATIYHALLEIIQEACR